MVPRKSAGEMNIDCSKCNDFGCKSCGRPHRLTPVEKAVADAKAEACQWFVEVLVQAQNQYSDHPHPQYLHPKYLEGWTRALEFVQRDVAAYAKKFVGVNNG
jgi:hypothetical protein